MQKLSKNSRIFVAGHRGMVGSAIVRQLESLGYNNVIVRSRTELDLTCQASVGDFFQSETIDAVFLAAAKVGGIHANNTYPAEFIHDNLMIQNNIIHQSYANGVDKLLFLGSSCIYPRLADQPMMESALLSGELEPTNEPYAIAKITGIKMCESYNRQYGVDFRSVMPTNLYGPGDNFHPENSHVIPALMRRFHEAKINSATEVTVWGSGNVQREFLHVDDMASACIHIMSVDRETYWNHVSPRESHVNVGTGEDISIRELALALAEITGYEGQVLFDGTKPEGTPRKLLSVDRLRELGWEHSIEFRSGLKDTYDWYCAHYDDARH
ncbi:MAG: GDP-L-fucose synthase [Endozoicomonas sp.]